MSEFEEFIDISFCAGTTKVNIASVKIYVKCVCVYIYIQLHLFCMCKYVHTYTCPSEQLQSQLHSSPKLT